MEAATYLDSLKNDMDTDYCENMQPNVAGATSYFYGIYQRSSDGWRGEEQWIPTQQKHGLLQKEKLAMLHGLSVQTNKRQQMSFGDFSLEVNGTLDRQKTDCPEGLWENEEQWSTTYNILLEGGDSIVYFQSDGDMVDLAIRRTMRSIPYLK